MPYSVAMNLSILLCKLKSIDKSCQLTNIVTNACTNKILNKEKAFVTTLKMQLCPYITLYSCKLYIQFHYC